MRRGERGAVETLMPHEGRVPALRLSFEPPRDGWLPVVLSQGLTRVEFAASDVPRDPVQDLIDALELAFRHREARVWWHLEPAGYFFDFAPNTEGVQLRVTFSEDSRRSGRREVLTTAGTPRQILLPLWRGLRQLASFNPQEPDWPSVDFSPLPALGEALRGRSG